MKPRNFLDRLIEPKAIFLIIQEGKKGIECYADPDLKFLYQSHKDYIKAFLFGVIKSLDDETKPPLKK